MVFQGANCQILDRRQPVARGDYGHLLLIDRPMSSVNLQDFSVPASACVEAMARNRVDHVVTVPDWVQLALHQRLEEGLPGVRLVGCCSENQVVTVAAGLALGGKRP
eukprot:gene59435-79306_t